MSGRVYREVEFDLADFDDADVLAYAATLGGGEGWDASLVRELSGAIERGDKADAHLLLDRILSGNPNLQDAAEQGKRARVYA